MVIPIAMMATTHGFVALALAVALLPDAPGEAAPGVVLAAAFLGGVAPDLDLLADHRKTLHFPVVGSALAAAVIAVAALTGSGEAVVAGTFLGAAGVHAVSDVLGGSAEPEPWNPTTGRGVYDHVAGVWRRPRRFVRYSGSPGDFLLCIPFAGVAVLTPATGPTADAAILAVLVLSGVYTAVRRRLGTLAQALSGAVPAWHRPAVADESDPVGNSEN
jgi:hypothetical protein